MTQKFIDRDGLKVLWNQISLKDYPNNETLMAVIDAIDETKANKDELFSKSWNDLRDRTHYTEVIDPIDFTWDGNLSNITTYETTYDGDTIYCIKVSDTVVVNKESRLSFVKVQRLPNLTSTRDIPISYFVEENGYLCHSEEFPSRGNIELAYIFIITTEEGASSLGLPETGIYVNYKPSGNNASYYFEEFHIAGEEVVHKLDSKYLPTDTQYITTIPSEKYPLNSPEEFLELPNGFYNISEFGHKFPMVVSIPMGYDEDNNEIFEEKLLFGFISKRNTDILCYNLGFMFGGLEAYNGCFRAIGAFSLDGFGQKEFADFEGFLFSEVIGDDVLSTESSTLIGAINELNANKASTEYVDENFALKSDLDNIDLSGLETKEDANLKLNEVKDYVDTRVDELFQNVSNGKELIASAITDKGVYASDDETFQELSDKIGLIPVGPPGTNIIGYIDEENDIYVSLTELESGTYTLKFEDYTGLLEDFDDIGTVEVE